MFCSILCVFASAFLAYIFLVIAVFRLAFLTWWTLTIITRRKRWCLIIRYSLCSLLILSLFILTQNIFWFNCFRFSISFPLHTIFLLIFIKRQLILSIKLVVQRSEITIVDGLHSDGVGIPWFFVRGSWIVPLYEFLN